MTKQKVALMLTTDERGKKQVDIAQMNQVVKKLSARLKGRHGMAILRALLASLLLVVTGCAAFTADKLEMVKDNIEVAVGTLGAGKGRLACTLEKDAVPYGTALITWECRNGADGKLAGCTDPTFDVKPLQ